ncbi:MAG: YggT family protein [Chloroflexales bacterium]|jgi:YGGT family
MIEHETERTSSSAAMPVRRDVYRETTVDVAGTPAPDGAARNVYEKRVSGPGGEHIVHTEHVSVPSEATRRGVGVTRAKQTIYFVFSVINILLAIRFALLLLGANEVSGFVSFIYRLSHAFVLPFRGIFVEPVLGTSVFEWAALIGIIIYSLLAYGLVRIIELVYAPVRPTVTRTP